MSRFKLILMSVFAVLAFSALASASASAEGCGDGGTKNLFCFSPSNVEIHELAVAGESGLALLATTIGTVTVRLHCTDDLFNGTLHLLGLATGEIDFLGCTVEKPAGQGCTVGGANKLILALLHLQLNAGIMPATGLATGSGTGGETEEFTKVTIAGASCTVAGTYGITGLQTLEFPKGEESLKEHEIVATKANSHLNFGGNAASFSSTAKVHLDSNEPWLIMLGT